MLSIVPGHAGDDNRTGRPVGLSAFAIRNDT